MQDPVDARLCDQVRRSHNFMLNLGDKQIAPCYMGGNYQGVTNLIAVVYRYV